LTAIVSIRTALLLAILATALPSTRCGRSPRLPAGSNLLLITVDTLRPDALGWIAGGDGTPSIDRLAASGFRFRSAVAPVPLTLPSHTTIMTGLDPRRHGVRANGQVVPEGLPTLASTLRGAGYATAGFVSGFPLRSLFGLDAGFDRYDDDLPGGDEGWLERPALETSRAALEWIGQTSGPWFVWVHYYDPHSPYEPPRNFWRPGPRGSYEGEVSYADHAIGELLDGIPVATAERLLTVFTADHGEAFGEHEERDHGLFLYDTTTLVPLVFHHPDGLGAGESSLSPRLADLFPTVAELLGVPPPPDLDGVSLAPLLRGGSGEIPPAALETRYPWNTYGWAPLRALRTERFKLIDAPRVELYDLEADPGESNNIALDEPARVASLMEELDRIDSVVAAESETVVDAEILEKLRGLGYVGGSTNNPAPPDDLADPKDRIAERDRLLAAESLLRSRRYSEALAIFDQVLAADPDNKFAMLRSGMAHLKNQNLTQAVARLVAAVELDPGQPEARYALADALTRSNRFEEALPHWMETVRLQPRRAAAWSNLGSTLAWSGRMDEALDAYAHAAELDPDDPLLAQNLEAARDFARRSRAE